MYIAGGVLLTATMYNGGVGDGWRLGQFHKCNPKSFAALVAEERLLGSQSEDGFQLQLGFTPLEDENAVGFQHTEALFKAHGQLRLPVLIELAEPLIKVGGLASPYQMRRVEHHHLEAAVREWHGREVADGVWMHHHQLPVRQKDFLIADVHELHEGIVFVEPKHPASTTCI